MTGIANTFTILKDFPPVSTEDWEARIQEDLKGADYEKKLIWHTLDGMKLQPYYRQEDLKNRSYLRSYPGNYPYVRGNKDNLPGWDIQQDIWVENPTGANGQARNALSKGATAICFMITGQIKSSDDLNLLLQDLALPDTTIHFKLQENHYQLFEWYVQYIDKLGIEPSQVKGSINLSPLSKLTTTGNFYQSLETDMKMLAGTLKKYGKTFPRIRFIPVEAHLFADAGASVSQEPGYGLAMASDYLARLTDLGLAVKEIVPHIQFNVGTGPEYFLEIAKVRAIRLLWSQIVKTYDPSSEHLAKVHIHSQTSQWNKTLYDPYVNMLRLTTEAMSAAIGGCDSLSIQPFDEVYGYTSQFSERIARNTQIILKEEAQLDKTIDPAAGSYYIENITDELADKAWQLFKRTEAKSGYGKLFLTGEIREKINETARKRDMNMAMRKEVLLGTNQYPNPVEKLRDEIKTSRQEIFYPKPADMICKPLRRYRAAQAFEALRMQTDKCQKCPSVFLFTIGDLNWRKTRASFAYGFFACAGYGIMDNLGFNSVDEGVQATRETQADIVVICSSDNEYAELALPIYEQLKDEAIIVVAGMPSCADHLKQGGMEHFIHIKSDMLETLQEFHQKLNIK